MVMSVWVFVFVLIVAIILFGILFKSEIQKSIEKPLEDSEQECSRVSGEWMEFSNGCVDSCDYRKNPGETFCTLALAYGCECGEDACWNGETCEKEYAILSNMKMIDYLRDSEVFS